MAGHGSSVGGVAEAVAQEFEGGERSLAAAAAQVTQQFEDGAGVPREEAPAHDPRAQEEYTFDFEFEDSRGRRFSGKFTNKALTRAEQRRVAAIETQLNGGAPYATVPPLVGPVHHMIAWMEVSLTKRPPFAKDLDAIRSNRLIEKLYSEVWSHQTYFCGDED